MYKKELSKRISLYWISSKDVSNPTSLKYNLKYDDILVNPSKGTLSKENKNLELTKNEMIVFTYLLANRGKIVTRDDLMTDLWNNNEFINDNALTVNISRLRTKLETFGLKDVIETRKGQGYKLLWN